SSVASTRTASSDARTSRSSCEVVVRGPVKRTSPLHVASLVAVGIVLGSLLRPLSVQLDGTVPRVGWTAAVLLVFSAGAVGTMARITWAALRRDKKRMTSDHGVKMLAVAKASIIVGGLFGGFYGGIALSFVRDWDTELGRERVLQGGAAALAGILLLVAGLLLERFLAIQDDDEDDDATGRASTPA
ncbi:MAG: DUF3180 family protein, partial [Actinomycetales bacterium]